MKSNFNLTKSKKNILSLSKTLSLILVFIAIIAEIIFYFPSSFERGFFFFFYVVIWAIGFLATIIYMFGFFIIGKEYKIKSFLSMPLIIILFVLSHFIFNDEYMIIINHLLFLLFGTFLLINSSIFKKLKIVGSIGIINSLLSLILIISLRYVEHLNWSLVLRAFIFSLVGVSILLQGVYFFFQYRFFKELTDKLNKKPKKKK